MKLQLSKRIEQIGFSSTLQITNKAAELKRSGLDIIDLSVGEPDFPTPENIKNAAKLALDQNKTRYTANDGILEIRNAIVDYYAQNWNAVYKKDEVIVSTGAKQCLYNVCAALLDKDDEVIIPLPYWVSYPHMVNLAEGKPVFVNTTESNHFRMTVSELESAITSKTKAVIINNPSNPTGSAYEAKELEELVEICAVHNILIISDEIYEKLVYDAFPFKSICSLGAKAKAQTLIVSGFSKSYAMTGWRLGFALGNKELIQGMSKIQSHATSNPNSIAQWAGVEALTGSQEEIAKMRNEFEKRRDYMHKRITSIPNITCCKPNGAFYLFPNVSAYIGKRFNDTVMNSSKDLSLYLLDIALTAVVPGCSFGAEGFIRLSYATSMENLVKSMDRIEDAMRMLV